MDSVHNPYSSTDDRADRSIPTASLQIYDHINSTLARADSTHINRASSASMCVKRRWYQGRGIKGEATNPRKIMNFALGDLTERVLLSFIKDGLVGEGKLYKKVDLGKRLGSLIVQGREIDIHEQEELKVEEDGLPLITAHADGFGLRNADNKWELIEIKSAADYGFKEFQKVGAKDYLKQAMTVLSTTKARTLEAKEVRFFFLRKSTGHIWDKFEPFDAALWSSVRTEFLTASSETEPSAPYAAYEVKGRKLLSFPCAGYCPYTKVCQGNYDIEWKVDQWGHYRPTYVITKEKSHVLPAPNEW